MNTASELLGIKLAFPMFISPGPPRSLSIPMPKAATHAGATAASNTPLIVSNVATLPVEKIAAAAKGPWWVQLYPQPGPDYNRQTLEEAQAAGRKAVVVTVDQQASSTSAHCMTAIWRPPPDPRPRASSGPARLPATPTASPITGSGTNGSCSTISGPWSRSR